MCIAVIKTKGADFPTKEQFENCFINNPHGAGFMYSDGKNLIIKKGLMTFEEFYNTFQNEKLSKDQLVFFHFRISTQYDINGKVNTHPFNTHPFPVSGNIRDLLKTENKFNGLGLMHNGIINYAEDMYTQYGTNSNDISDTMLLCLRLNDVVDYLNGDFNKLKEFIDYDADFYNKIAIMNVNEEYIKIGQWIERNGVFYSNMGFSPMNLYWNKKKNQFKKNCFVCGQLDDIDYMYDTNEGFLCEECAEYFDMYQCEICKKHFFKEEFYKEDIIDDEEKLIICPSCQNYYNIEEEID